MSRRLHLPHPVFILLVLLLAVVLFSWIGSMAMMRDSAAGDPVLRSLLDSEGIRAMVRGAGSAIAAAPVGSALLLLMAVGVFRSSGIVAFFSSGASLKERRAMLLAAITLALILALYIFGLLGGKRVLLGFTGSLRRSPMLDGGFFLLFILVSVPSIVYGLTADRFRTAGNILEGMVSRIPAYASYFVALLVSSQLMAAVSWSGLDTLLGIGPNGFKWLSAAAYWLPMLHIALVIHRK